MEGQGTTPGLKIPSTKARDGGRFGRIISSDILTVWTVKLRDELRRLLYWTIFINDQKAAPIFQMIQDFAGFVFIMTQ